MGNLLSIFTGEEQEEAAEQTRNYYSGVKSDLTNTYGAAKTSNANAITTGYGNANNALTTGYNTATGATNTGADSSLAALASGASTAQDYLTNAGNAYNSLDALSAKYGGATTLALNSLGVNGQAGTDAARSAFTASPAYNFNLEQGLDAITRRSNMAGGNTQGGNVDRDAQTYGAGQASNQYDTWMNNLLGFTGQEASVTGQAASGRAGVATNQANIANNLGINQAGVESNRGSMLASLGTQYGQNTANLATGQASAETANNNTYASNMGNTALSIASPYTNTYSYEADAESQGAGNLWNLGMNVAKLATGQAGSGKGTDYVKLAMGG